MAKWRKHKKTSHTRDQRGQPIPEGDHKSDVDLTISNEPVHEISNNVAF